MNSAELAPIGATPSIVHVCAFDVSRHFERLADLRQSLSPEEHSRAQRFLQEADRRRFILGRAVVRHLCGRHLQIEPAGVQLGQTWTGKPYLPNPVCTNQKHLEFNVAHSGNCVLIAWTEGGAVGVDVEALDRSSPALLNEVSGYGFSRAECAALSAAKPDELIVTFYRIWVRKEAVLKGEGCGLSGSLRSFSVACRHVSRTEWPDEVCYPASGRRWRIIDLVPAPDYAAALVLPEGSIMNQCTPREIGPWAEL
jgi:4'-phosphopantetheinyl transferase